MALSKSEGRNSFASTNSSAGDWPHSEIPVKLSLIREHFTPGRRSAREHWFPTMAHGLERRASKPGSVSPQANSRMRMRKPREKPASTSITGGFGSALNERCTHHDVHKNNFGVRMSHVRHLGGAGGPSNATPLERPNQPSRQRRPDDHGGVSAGQF